MTPTERRAELMRQEGREVDLKRAHVNLCKADRATIIKVNRTKALVQFPCAPMVKVRRRDLCGFHEWLEPEQWNVPLDWLLLPGCLESDPRQLELF